jgi:hypothetical protein
MAAHSTGTVCRIQPGLRPRHQIRVVHPGSQDRKHSDEVCRSMSVVRSVTSANVKCFIFAVCPRRRVGSTCPTWALQETALGNPRSWRCSRHLGTGLQYRYRHTEPGIHVHLVSFSIMNPVPNNTNRALSLDRLLPQVRIGDHRAQRVGKGMLRTFS